MFDVRVGSTREAYHSPARDAPSGKTTPRFLLDKDGGDAACSTPPFGGRSPSGKGASSGEGVGMAEIASVSVAGYRFLRGVFQYSAGVAAEPGFEIERARFLRLKDTGELLEIE